MRSDPLPERWAMMVVLRRSFTVPKSCKVVEGVKVHPLFLQLMTHCLVGGTVLKDMFRSLLCV